VRGERPTDAPIQPSMTQVVAPATYIGIEGGGWRTSNHAFMHTHGPTQPVSLIIIVHDGDCGEGPRKVDPCTHISPHSCLRSTRWRLWGGPTESGPMRPHQPTRLSPKYRLEIVGRAHGKWTHAPASAHMAVSKVQIGDCGEGPRKVDPCTRISPCSCLRSTNWRLWGGPTESGPMRPHQPTQLSPKYRLKIAGRAHGKWTHAPASAHMAIFS